MIKYIERNNSYLFLATCRLFKFEICKSLSQNSIIYMKACFVLYPQFMKVMDFLFPCRNHVVSGLVQPHCLSFALSWLQQMPTLLLFCRCWKTKVKTIVAVVFFFMVIIMIMTNWTTTKQRCIKGHVFRHLSTPAPILEELVPINQQHLLPAVVSPPRTKSRL